MIWRGFLKAVHGAAPIAVAALGAIGAAWWVHDLGRMESFAIPLAWEKGGDNLFNVLLAQNILENGWYQENSRLGLPGQLELYDWPGAVLFPMLIFKAIGWFLPHAGAIVNLFYLMGWPLTAMVAAFVLRRLGVASSCAAALGVVFSALPAHALRGEPHLFLASLWLVPPAILVTCRLLGDSGVLTPRARSLSLAYAAILGASDAYYGFFAVALVAGGALVGWLRVGGFRRLLEAGLFAAGTALGLLAAIAPSLMWGDRTVVERSSGESEVLGLKLAQLVLPTTGHRLEAFRQLTARYNESGSAPGLINENITSAVGALGTLGLLVLLYALLRGRLPATAASQVRALAEVGGLAFLIGTVGGLGSLFALLVSAQIRGYNRISVFLAFIALAALGLLATSLGQKLKFARSWPLAALVAVFGVWDQSSLWAVPRHAENARSWELDGEWVALLERQHASPTVFYLPYVAFPESLPAHQMFNYDPLRPILRSTTARWSYGAMKHRDTDLWHRSVAALDMGRMLVEVRDAGFSHLVVDTWGLEADGATLRPLLEQQLGDPVVVSRDGRWLCFRLFDSPEGSTG